MRLTAFNLAAQGAAITTQGAALLCLRIFLPESWFLSALNPG
jgi:hypothetical protein